MGLLPSGIGFFPKAKGHYFERAGGSPELILILCAQGKGWARYNRREVDIAPGQLLVIRHNSLMPMAQMSSSHGVFTGVMRLALWR
jgi:hypothetical protein